MVFQSPTGIENNRKVQLGLAIILIFLMLGFLLYARLNTPSKDSVDGVYRNACCGDIIIRGGRISYGDTALDMKLRNMKFGLTGYVDGKFTSRGIRASKDPTSIIFSNQGTRRVLSLPIDQEEHRFQMTAGSAGMRR